MITACRPVMRFVCSSQCVIVIIVPVLLLLLLMMMMMIVEVLVPIGVALLDGTCTSRVRSILIVVPLLLAKVVSATGFVMGV